MTKSTSNKVVASKTAVGRTRPRVRPQREGAVTRDDWLAAARKALVRDGIDQVKIERLSEQIGVRRSSFYWNFRSRAELLHALLDHWEATNTGPLLRAVDAAISAGVGGIHLFTRLWIEEREFNPAYDTAVRDWARKDPEAARVVQAVDDKRLEALTRLMAAYGHQGTEAVVRARILYYHQIGYYALGIREATAERLRLEPYYVRALIGRDV